MAARRCRIIALVFALLVNALDFISDWLFYNSASRVEKGLVYGPVDPHQVTALLVFSIIGSVGFVVQIAVFFFELRREDFHGDLLLDLVSAIIIWIEDIPQVIISFSIALCREEAISIFQLIKAGLVLVGVVISIVATLIRLCRNYDCRAVFCGVRFCLMLGILIEAGFAAAIFSLTQTEQNSNGEMTFRVPTTVITNHLSDQRYFTDVNLFVHHADLFDAWNLDTNKKDSAVNWLRLFSLYDLKDNERLSFKLNYDHVGIQVLNLTIWIATSKYSKSNVKWKLSECYSLNQKTADVTLLPNTACSDVGIDSNNTETFYFDFRFEEPDNGIFFRKRVFGEIFFNLKVSKNGICSDGNFEDPLRNSGTLYFPLTFHYFRINDFYNATDVDHLYKDHLNVTRFFRKNTPDMTDVADAWNTGWNKCASTGSFSPLLDRNMEMVCD